MTPLNFTRALRRPQLISCLVLALAQGACGADGGSDSAGGGDGQTPGHDSSNDNASGNAGDDTDNTPDESPSSSDSNGGGQNSGDDGANNGGSDTGSDDGGDSSGDGSDSGYVVRDIPASELCTELTTLLCEAEQKCCTSAAKRHDSVDACVDAKITACLNDFAPAASDARTGYSPKLAGEQLGALYEQLDRCALDMGEWFVAKDGLMSVFTGTVQSGGACTPSGTTDVGAVLSCAGDSVCNVSEGLLPTFKCGSYKQAGGACVSEIECAEGLRCDIPTGSLIGKCASRLADGASCKTDGDCSSLLCRNERCIARSEEALYCFK